MPYVRNSGDSRDTLANVLGRLYAKVDNSKANIINVDRHNVLDGALRAFRRATFRPWRRPSVKFSGEDAIDEGGPRREFFRLLVTALNKLPVFEGPLQARSLSPSPQRE